MIMRSPSLCRRGLRATLQLTLLLTLSMSAAAAEDVAGSRDPAGIERFPRSWIHSYEQDPSALPREFVMSRVDRIRRETRADEVLRVDAPLERATYQMPAGVSVAQVVRHYREVLGGEVLFRCNGRDCGRSNDWANQIFEQAILYGPDANQHYSALEYDDQLVALYVIERGNKRVYAHVEVIDPGQALAREPNRLLPRRLSERGWAVIEAVTPGPEGEFDDRAADVLASVADALTDIPGEFYLVCHLYGSASADSLLGASQRCADQGIALILDQHDAVAQDQAPVLRPFGAGPLLPRGPDVRSRLELVAPSAVLDYLSD